MTLPNAPFNAHSQPGLELFFAVFHKNPEAIGLARASDGLLVDVNFAWCMLTGYSREEVIGKTTQELGLWEKPEVRDQMVDGLSDTSEGVAIEAVLIAKEGTRRMIRLTATRFVLEGENHLLGYIRDVTGENDSASALRGKLEFIHKLTSQVPGLIFQFRMRPDGSSHFPFATGQIRQIFGINPEDVVDDASKAFSKVHPEDLVRLQRGIVESGQDLKRWREEFRVQLEDGSQRWMLSDSMPERQEDGSVVWHGFIMDVSEQRSERVELQKARELMTQKAAALSIALDNMSQGIVMMDASHRVNLHNKRYFELLGLPESLFESQPMGGDLIRYQAKRGDFGNNFDRLEPVVKAFIVDGFLPEGGVDRMLYRTPKGLSLEIKATPLSEGGMVITFSDVTHFIEAQGALHESESRFRSLTALSSDWYWEQDENFKFVRIDGHDVSQTIALGMTRWEAGDRGLTEAQWAEHKRVLQAHQTFRDFEMQNLQGNGQMVWSSISGVPIFDAHGVFRGYRGIGRDITEQKRIEDESQRLAFYDTLTGLPNRRLLLDRLSKSLVVGVRTHQRGALLFIDLDNFKDLNDTQGHDVGDKLLEMVANRLVTCIRQGDTVARFGGDEFVVMLEGLSSGVGGAVAQVKVVGQKILESLNRPFDLMGKEHYSTPSIGIALFGGQTQTVEELLKRADLAMYQAKAAGRNTMRFFDPDMQAAVAERAAVEVDLRHGLEHGELVLYYQPIVNQANAMTGVEALVRWHHPRRGMVSPIDFIPVAEQTGLILPLGQWVLRTACEQLVTWSRSHQTRGLSVSVNISAREFRQPEFTGQLLEILKTTTANPNQLKLELTESLLLSDMREAVRKMDLLRAVGVSFSLDDFGTGYSSLSYLKRLPLDQLKIDQSFVRDVLSDPNDAAIARTVIALAHSLGLTVVAEGVETAGQRDFLVLNGCESYQGYLFGRPVPPEELNFDSIASGFASTVPHSL